MKKTITILFLLFSFQQNFASALFSYDKKKVNDAVQHITAVENFVTANNFTYTEALETNAALMALANLTAEGDTMVKGKNPVMGIPSFTWGCCLGPLGLIAVYTDHDATGKDINNAIGGCVINGACIAGSALTIFLLKGICSNMDLDFMGGE